MLKEIGIRVISGVLVVLIVFIVFELIRKYKKPCGCKGNKEEPPVQEQRMPDLMATAPKNNVFMTYLT